MTTRGVREALLLSDKHTDDNEVLEDLATIIDMIDIISSLPKQVKRL